MKTKAVRLYGVNDIRLEEFEKGLEMVRERPNGFVKALFTFDD